MFKRLGKTNIAVSPLGLGCWAIGGPFKFGGLEDGWGQVDDNESLRAIRRAMDVGINFFDTSDAYGAGRSEEVLGKAIRGRRQDAVVATKFGFPYHEGLKEVYDRYDMTPSYIREACEMSLRRLGTEYIDLYQIHPGLLSDEELRSAIDALDGLKQAGKIRAYGWSTGDPNRAERFAERSDGSSIQHTLNVFAEAKELVDVCERHGMSSIANTPLAMGLLSGKFSAATKLPPTDVRGSGHEWVTYFKEGKPDAALLSKLDAVREILGSDGRSLVQGALGWIWGRSGSVIPIPGFKTRMQVEDLAKAMIYGPLSPGRMDEIDRLLGSVETGA